MELGDFIDQCGIEEVVASYQFLCIVDMAMEAMDMEAMDMEAMDMEVQCIAMNIQMDLSMVTDTECMVMDMAMVLVIIKKKL